MFDTNSAPQPSPVVPKADPSPPASQLPAWWPMVERSFLAMAAVVFLSVILGIVLCVPNPTEMQTRVFLIILGLAAAAFTVFLPGTFHIEVPGYIKAGGALGVFAAVIWLNPVSFASTPQSKEGVAVKIEAVAPYRGTGAADKTEGLKLSPAKVVRWIPANLKVTLPTDGWSIDESRANGGQGELVINRKDGEFSIHYKIVKHAPGYAGDWDQFREAKVNEWLQLVKPEFDRASSEFRKIKQSFVALDALNDKIPNEGKPNKIQPSLSEQLATRKREAFLVEFAKPLHVDVLRSTDDQGFTIRAPVIDGKLVGSTGRKRLLVAYLEGLKKDSYAEATCVCTFAFTSFDGEV